MMSFVFLCAITAESVSLVLFVFDDSLHMPALTQRPCRVNKSLLEAAGVVNENTVVYTVSYKK